MELAGKGQRELAGILAPSALAVGIMLSAFTGYFLRDFHDMLFVMAVAHTAILSLFL